MLMLQEVDPALHQKRAKCPELRKSSFAYVLCANGIGVNSAFLHDAACAYMLVCFSVKSCSECTCSSSQTFTSLCA
jgi:hypothetical protein